MVLLSVLPSLEEGTKGIDARMLKFERGISTRKGWKRTAEGGEGPGDCLSPGQTEMKIFARRLDFDVAEIHLNLAFSPSRGSSMYCLLAYLLVLEHQSAPEDLFCQRFPSNSADTGSKHLPEGFMASF